MNKLASINYLQLLGLPTEEQLIVIQKGKEEKQLEEILRQGNQKWCIRCAEEPNMDGKMEIKLPWALADSYNLIKSVKEMEREVKGRYHIFIHPSRLMPKGGNLLVTGDEIIIESVSGNYMDVSKLTRGTRNPDEVLRFRPGMMSFYREGKTNLSTEELAKIRYVERALNYSQIDALTSPVAVEFSFDGEKLTLHDVIVGNRAA